MAKDRQFWMVCWNPGVPGCIVTPWPDTQGLGDRYAASDFDCYLNVRRMTKRQRLQRAMDVLVKVVLDGSHYPGICDEFAKIPEVSEEMRKARDAFARYSASNTPSRR